MRRLLPLFLITSVFVVTPVFAQKRLITEKDLFNFVWIGDPQISPDSSRVAFVKVTVNDKKDGYNTSIWLVSTTGGETYQLTNGTRDSSPRCTTILPTCPSGAEGTTTKSAGVTGAWHAHPAATIAARQRVVSAANVM